MRFNINTRLILKVVSLSIFLFLLILPIAKLFYTVLPPELLYNPESFGKLKNYFSFMYSSRLIHIFLRTILLGAGASILGTILGTSLAIILECTDLPFKNFFRIGSIIPFLIPPYISTIGWMLLLGERGNFSNLSFNIYNLPFSIVILGLSFFPIVYLLTTLAIRNIDPNLEEAANLLSSSRRGLSKIILPLILPHVLAGSFFVFVLSIAEYGVPSLLRVNTFTSEIFAQFSAYFNFKKAVVFSFPMVFLGILLIFLYYLIIRKRSYVTISSFTSRGKEIFELSPKKKILGVSFVLAVFTFSAIIPISALFIQSKLKFLEAFSSAFKPLLHSILFAGLGASLMCIIGFFLAYYFDDIWDLLILFPITLPSSIVGVALIGFWNTSLTEVIYSSFLMIIIGYFVRFLPFVVKTFRPFFLQIDPKLEESARSSGASFLKILRKILLPLMKPGILIAWFVGFVFSMRELGTTLLVNPPGFQTLSVKIETLMHYGAPEYVASLSLGLLFIIFLPIIIVFFIRKRWYDE